ncbi:MAG: TIGR03546 family protein [Calditrichaeota bacterium]|nr:MAG: TIGR03546 family protein [Calditrichota bacterium]MBL1204834.1 TIGR03546 family protein [Calditrichota bacterium]NOG44663.1 TIGR03546 family protein [Calditrichota bacterium]
MQFIGKLITILHSGASPAQIAGGFVLGMIVGLTPFWSLHNLLVLFVIIILNVNIAISIASFALFSLFAYLFDPLFHSFGYFLLVDLSFMQGFYTMLYNIQIVALSRFNNTVVMGSLVTSLILLIPVFGLTKNGVIKYRDTVLERFEKLKVVKAVKGTKLYGWYAKYAEWRA